ncbi:MAG TPA: ribbon-helix-helix protein, CopG family [Actinomycetota bacterium]|nr:ribbon-helix-helix protein, CopG family [Actinomycetota bacterium]
MARRTQITLEDEQYDLLRRVSATTGLSMAELIRRALDRTYARRGVEALDATFGMWRDRSNIDDLMKRLRPGLGKRLVKDRGGAR